MNVILVFVLHPSVAIIQTYLFEFVVFLFPPLLTYLNHIKTRSSSTILLLFWPVYIAYLALWTRTILATDSLSSLRIPFALRWSIGFVGFLAFALECMGPEWKPENLDAEGKPIHESPLVTANIFSVWTFGWMTPLMKMGVTRYITEEDLPPLLPKDETEKLGADLQGAMKGQCVLPFKMIRVGTEGGWVV